MMHHQRFFLSIASLALMFSCVHQIIFLHAETAALLRANNRLLEKLEKTQNKPPSLKSLELPSNSGGTTTKVNRRRGLEATSTTTATATSITTTTMVEDGEMSPTEFMLLHYREHILALKRGRIDDKQRVLSRRSRQRRRKPLEIVNRQRERPHLQQEAQELSKVEAADDDTSSEQLEEEEQVGAVDEGSPSPTDVEMQETPKDLWPLAPLPPFPSPLPPFPFPLPPLPKGPPALPPGSDLAVGGDDSNGSDVSINFTDACNVPDREELGNSICKSDQGYNTAECGWDGGDCCYQTCRDSVDSDGYVKRCGYGDGYDCRDPHFSPLHVTYDEEGEEDVQRRRERQALKALYNATNGDGWRRRGQWLSDTIDHCYWDPWSIGCTPEEGYVWKINLHNNNLSGTLPNEIGDIVHLENLWLDGNLDYELDGNKLLSGTLPGSIGNLTKLTLLYLGGTSLSSTIPSSLGMLTKLRWLNVNGTSLSGPVPANVMTLIFGDPDSYYAADNTTDYADLSPDNCADVVGWVDQNGNGCERYSSDTSSCPSSGTQRSNMGHTADTACCACGPHARYDRESANDCTVNPQSLGDGYCHEEYNTLECGWDGGDCCWQTCTNEYGCGTYECRDPRFRANYDEEGERDTQRRRERHTLRVLYDATNGDGWFDQGRWLDDSLDHCYWDQSRIKCTGGEGYVWWIDLSWSDLHSTSSVSGNNLTGTLPTELGQLVHLKHLGLHGNKNLSGTLPASIGNLTELTSLDLSSTSLSGTIPSSMGKLTELFSLYVAGTSLSGPVPANLMVAIFGSPYWYDDPDDTMDYADLSPENCSDVVGWADQDENGCELYSNETSCPSNVTHHDNTEHTADTACCSCGPFARHYRLKDACNVSDPDLLGDGRCDYDSENTTGYNTEECGWDGGDCCWQSCSDGAYICGENTRYDCRNPMYIVDSPDRNPQQRIWERDALKALYDATNGDGWKHSEKWLNNKKDHCYWDPERIRCTGGNGYVRQIDLSNIGLRGTLPNSLGRQMSAFSFLRVINLSDNNLTGTVPWMITSLPSVKEIRLSRNIFSSTLPARFAEVIQLERLDVDNNELTGVLPIEFGQLRSLRELRLSNNRFGYVSNSSIASSVTPGIPPEWGDLANVEYLDLSGNSLAGRIPRELAKLGRISHLYLHDNNFSGTIPEELGHLPRIRNLTLSSNEALAHPAPLSVCTLSSRVDLASHFDFCPVERNVLEKFFYATNGNSWAVNTNWLREYDHPCDSSQTWFGITCANESEITGISLIGNGLYGTLPTEVFELTGLRDLKLGDNRLYGTLPSDFEQNTNLEILQLSGNEFSGEIPMSIQNLSNLSLLHLHANKFTSDIPVWLQTSNLTADCGEPYYYGKLSCQDCDICCNSESKCIENDKGRLSLPQKTGLFVGCITAFLIILWAIVFTLSSFTVLPIPKCTAVDYCGQASVYRFFLTKSVMGWILTIATVAAQLGIFAMFLSAANIDTEDNVWEYDMICLPNQLWCESYRIVKDMGWLVFGVLMLAFLGKDVVSGVMLVYTAGLRKDLFCFMSGIIIWIVTACAIWTTVQYNFALLLTSTVALIENAVIILFINEIDERMFELSKILFPEWVAHVMQESQKHSEDICAECINTEKQSGIINANTEHHKSRDQAEEILSESRTTDGNTGNEAATPDLEFVDSQLDHQEVETLEPSLEDFCALFTKKSETQELRERIEEIEKLFIKEFRSRRRMSI